VKVYIALSSDCCGEPFCGMYLTLDEAKKEGDWAVEEWDTETMKKTRRWARWGWKDNDPKTKETLSWPEVKE
jgi:hypothetical protein